MLVQHIFIKYVNYKEKLQPMHYYQRSKYICFIRACSHEPGTVNYPGVIIAPGQALRVHMIICCPGASSSYSDHYESILIPLVFIQIVTDNDFKHVCLFLVLSETFC